MKNNILTVILVLKVYSTDLALHSYNILGHTVDSLKKKIDAAEPQILSFLSKSAT